MDDILGSKQRAHNAYGQNGSDQASSLLLGKTKANIAGVSPPVVNVPDDKWQTRDLRDKTAKSEKPVEVHPAMKSRAASSGSPGGVMSKTLDRSRSR